MKEIVQSLPNQINEAIEIGKKCNFKNTDREIRNILVCGLGGSGIGGRIVSQILIEEIKIPFLTSNDYDIPAFVDEHTLVIASSYSGNTEETIAAIEIATKRGAEIAVVTSGGKLLEMAKENNWNHAVVPSGEQPRAMLSYSIIQQFFLLNRYGIISEAVLNELSETASFIASISESADKAARNLALKITASTAIIYSDAAFESVAVRFRQQINENGKELCWHHALPEMNHNELVAWAGGDEHHAPIYLATDFDHPRTRARWKITKEIISHQTNNINEIVAKGNSRLQQFFYLIHLTDFVSIHMADIKEIDPVEVNVITHLKSEMAKV